MDLSDNVSEMNYCGRAPDRIPSSGSSIKTCVDCGTSKTPLWRGGPAGPKSLCNACGIRSRKKRRGLSGFAKEDKKCKKSSQWSSPKAGHHISSSSSQSSTSSSAESSLRNNRGDELKSGRGSWGDVALQKPRSNITRRRKLGEEEQAAFLLLALSCGSVYA